MEIGPWNIRFTRLPKKEPTAIQEGDEVSVNRARVLTLLDDGSYDPGVIISISGQRVHTTMMNLRSKVAER